MTKQGISALSSADWLLGFDFDGTLADVNDGHSVSPTFFETLSELINQQNIAWGICTGRSLEFLSEGILNAAFPIWPDYIVAQERDIFYHLSNGEYTPDESRNTQAGGALKNTLNENASTLAKVEDYVTNHSQAEWISIPSDPAGIIATHEDEIQEAVNIFNACLDRNEDIDYQRNTIYLRFTHKSYCKGTAVQYLQQQFNIPHRNTLVMGDNYNDITMLNSAVAKHYGGPANSIPKLKEALNSNGGFITKKYYSLGVTEAMQALIPVTP